MNFEILEALPQGVLVIDLSNRLIVSNRRFAELWRISQPVDREDQIARAIKNLTSPPDRSTEDILEVADGRFLLRESRPLIIANAVAGRVLTFLDVTAQRASEMERERFTSSILENIPDMIFVKDADKLQFVRFNKAGEALLGYSRTELLGKSDYDFFPKQEADFFTRNDREVLARGGVLDIPEEPIHTKTLGVRVLHTKKIPLYGAGGKPKYLLGISEDITIRKQVESEKRARRMAEEDKQRADYLSEISRSLAASLNLKETLGALAGALIPRLGTWSVVALVDDRGRPRISAVSHVDPRESSRMQRMLDSALEPDANKAVPKVIRTRETSIRTDLAAGETILGLRFSDPRARSYIAVPLRAWDRVLGAILCAAADASNRYGPAERSLIEDIAQRTTLAVENARLYEEAQIAIRIREKFISIASHELRTPLTSLTAQLQLFQRIGERGGLENYPQDRLIHLSKLSQLDLSRLNRLVENLLDVSRIGAGTLHLKTERTDIAKLVSSMVERMRSDLGAEEFRLRLCAEAPVWADVDHLRYEQVVANLVMNAVKFGRGGPIDIKISERKGSAVLQIRDQGIGIPKESLKIIFEPFERAVSERQFGGLGLGLYISNQIVHAHGGRIRVRSTVGRGSTFTVEIPLKAKTQNAEHRAA